MPTQRTLPSKVSGSRAVIDPNETEKKPSSKVIECTSLQIGTASASFA